jgi:hypothetical protein
MSPTSCRCSTPRRVYSVRACCLPRTPVWRGWGVAAAASPPKGSPPQYSPALRWVTTGFGMGPGGASTLSATGTSHSPKGKRTCQPLLHNHAAPSGREPTTAVRTSARPVREALSVLFCVLGVCRQHARGG